MSERPARPGRLKFGLDAPLPADPAIVERAILRHIAACRPSIVVLALSRPPERDSRHPDTLRLAAGIPDLLLLLPEGRLAFLVVKTQARDLTRAQRAFADLCRERTIPLHVVRSLPEARLALDRLLSPTAPETAHASQKTRHPGRIEASEDRR